MSSSRAKPVPLIGRLAVQMKLITLDQLNAATGVQSPSAEGKRLGEILVDLSFISPGQLEKLEAVHRGVLAKHRAKQAAAAAEAQRGVDAAPRQSQPEPSSTVSPSSQVAPSRGSPAQAPVAHSQTAETPRTQAQSPQAPPAQAVPAQDHAAQSQPAAPEPLAAASVQTSTPAPPAVSQAPPPRSPAATEDAPAKPKTTQPAAESEDEGDSLELTGATPTADDRERLHALLRRGVEAGSSDIHIHSGAPLKIRINGVLQEAGAEVFSQEDTERMVMAVLSPSERAELLQYGEVDACCEVPNLGRFRTNVYRQQRGFDAVLRVISKEPPTLEDLGLPSWIAKHTTYHQGMVLITGPAGCGKSATMAAMVNLINEERQDHILTVEDPIEIVHPSKRCLVNQRHAGRHTGSFARALRAALREDPDVIVIGELRDLETISLAMTAAETGHFVLATLHTNNAVRTINRMIGAFPSNQQGQVRTMLSESLRAVISQRLVATADESGRVAALELLVINKAIGNMIRDEKTIQIRSSIQTGSAHGMMLLEQSLNELVRSGTITKEAALELAEEKKLITAD